MSILAHSVSVGFSLIAQKKSYRFQDLNLENVNFEPGQVFLSKCQPKVDESEETNAIKQMCVYIYIYTHLYKTDVFLALIFFLLWIVFFLIFFLAITYQRVAPSIPVAKRHATIENHKES